MEAYELHLSVVQQMPRRRREALVTVDYADGEKNHTNACTVRLNFY